MERNKESIKRIKNIYGGMKKRCYTPTQDGYEYYGGRGIKICDEWLNDKEKFVEWALTNGYESSLSIDRIDVNGDYCPENCKWSDIKTQNRNKRNNHLIEHNGMTKTISEWEEYLGFKSGVLTQRIVVRGGDVHKAIEKKLFTPKTLTFRGETHTLTEWSKITGLKRITIRLRLERGWPISKTLTQKPRKSTNNT